MTTFTLSDEQLQQFLSIPDLPVAALLILSAIVDDEWEKNRQQWHSQVAEYNQKRIGAAKVPLPDEVLVILLGGKI